MSPTAKPNKRLSIIVPTPDGGQLNFLAASLNPQLRENDEVIVVGDTASGITDHLRMTSVFCASQQREGKNWRYFEYDNAGEHAWGHPQINFGMRYAVGDYLMFQDDDDIYYPDALVNVRRAIKHGPPRPFLFKFRAMRFGGRTFWVERGRVEEGMIGGHCLVVPNDPEKLGKWSDRYEGDFDFIKDTLDLWKPVEPEWRPEVIALAR